MDTPRKTRIKLYSKQELLNWNFTRTRYLALKYGLDPKHNLKQEELVAYILQRQEETGGELTIPELPKKFYLYLVYEDPANHTPGAALFSIGTEGTLTEETIKHGHAPLDTAVIVHAASPMDAISYCAKEGLFKITGRSRLVAAPIGERAASYVEEQVPRPFLVAERDDSYT